MSAAAGIAGKVIPMLPKLAGMLPMAKGALNIGKKVVGGIKNIFGRKMSGGEGTGENQVVRSGIGGMIDQGRQFAQGAGGVIDTGRQIYQGFKQGGFGGGMTAFQQQMPNIQRNISGMIDSGRSMYQQGRDMYQQTRGVIQGGMNDMQNMMRRRKGGMGMPGQLPWMRPGALGPGRPMMG